MFILISDSSWSGKITMPFFILFFVVTITHEQNIICYDAKYIWNNSYICTAVVDQSEEWACSKFSNLSSWKEEEKTNSGYKHNSKVSHGIFNHTSSEVTVTKSLKQGIGN